MYKLFASAIFAAFLSTNSYGATFLSDSESNLIPATERPAGLVVVKEAFEKHSETPALVLSVQNVYGHELMVVERDGVKAILVDRDVFGRLINEDSGISVRKIDDGQLMEIYCSSSCWDDAIGGAATGAVTGGGAVGAVGLGVGASWGAVGGPGGIAGGAAVGGAGGLVVGGVIGGIGGGIKEYNTCQKEHAEVCGDK